jgi:hypothetical protein
MTERTMIGFDNGITGTIGIIYPDGTSEFFKTPIIKEQNYTKAKANISRIDFVKLYDILKSKDLNNVMCLIERPMVNPGRFKASVSALRALEATLIIVELLKIPYQYIDSKEWQRELLPKGSTKDQLKKDSEDIGCRLFPQHQELIKKHKDADGILIAEYCRRKF